MGRIILIAACITMTACASTGPKLNCDQSCAMQNMVCTGQSMGESSGSSVNLSSLATSAGSSSNLTYHCAKDDAQAAKIEAFKTDANDTLRDEEISKKCSTKAPVGVSSKACDDWRERRKQRTAGVLPESERWKCVPIRMRENEEYRKLCESHQ